MSRWLIQNKRLMHVYARHHLISSSGVNKNSEGGMFKQNNFNRIEKVLHM